PRDARLALLESCLAADETALVESDEAIEPGLAGRVALRELARPDAETLLQPKGVEREIADLGETKILAGGKQRLAQGCVQGRRTVDLEAELASDRQPGDPRAHHADIELGAGHERQGFGGDVPMGGAFDDLACVGSGDKEAR